MRLRLSSIRLWAAIGLVVASGLLPMTTAFAQSASTTNTDTDFSLQVSPSPLVSTVEPGQVSKLEIRIRNSGSQTEALRIQPRSFTIDNSNESVKLDDTTPPDITDWLSFSAPNFTVGSGQTYTETLSVNVPQAAGFSYAFALVISRQRDPVPTVGSRVIKGSLALFTLINVDKPGASRKVDITKFTISKHIYEYLPAEMSIQFRNSGNTIVQPYGNIFIQRKSSDKTPLSTLAVNEKRGYILPSSTRTIKASWRDGFPVRADNGTLTWDWSKLSNLRIGKYTAKVVAVYNDGSRDVPIEGNISFWVIPWKIIAGLILLLAIVLFGIVSFIIKLRRISRRPKSTTVNKT